MPRFARCRSCAAAFLCRHGSHLCTHRQRSVRQPTRCGYTTLAISGSRWQTTRGRRLYTAPTSGDRSGSIMRPDLGSRSMSARRTRCTIRESGQAGRNAMDSLLTTARTRSYTVVTIRIGMRTYAIRATIPCSSFGTRRTTRPSCYTRS